MNGEMPYLDKLSRPYVAQFAGTNVHMFFSFITNFGGKKIVIPFTITMALVFLIMYQNIVPSLFFAFGTLGGHLLNECIKHVVQRERPSISVALGAEGFSFPSGHAMNAIICFGLFTYFLTKKIESKTIRKVLWTVASIVILLVGISRYVLNVHYLTDVIAGFFIGSLYVFCLLILFYKVYKK